MGQKVNPIGFRLGVNKDWQSNWYAGKDYQKYLKQDIIIRDFIEDKLKEASVSRVIIKRPKNNIEITVFTAKPGIVIGRGGEDISKLREEVYQLIKEKVYIKIVEEKYPDLSAKLVAESIALQIENRAPFRSAQKRAIRNTMKAGAKGVKTLVSGRLGGVEMARSEGYTEGTVPLHTLRADIDYAHREADTTYGKIGVKVWIHKPQKEEDSNVDAKKD